MRKICVVTGSRAEYGLLRPVMEAISSHPRLQLQVVVTGMHLVPEFGNTWREIEADGFFIDEKVDMLLASDTGEGMAKSVGLGTIAFTDTFKRLQPDIVLVLGDRFEILAAVQAAFFLRIPIAHISGGEITQGALDDAIRHCITKMAALHFPAAEPYRKRIIQMGEEPERVFNVGDPALDNLRRIAYVPRRELLTSLGLAPERPYFLVTLHPVTAVDSDPRREADILWKALAAFPQYSLLVTAANADAGGRIINDRLRRLCESEADRAVFVMSLGQRRYLSALKHCAAVIGNSSSGIVEAPPLRVPTVNIGPRQNGRLKAASIIDCDCEVEAIKRAVAKALDPSFRKILKDVRSPYGDCNASDKICGKLACVDLRSLTQKTFHDLGDD